MCVLSAVPVTWRENKCELLPLLLQLVSNEKSKDGRLRRSRHPAFCDKNSFSCTKWAYTLTCFGGIRPNFLTRRTADCKSSLCPKRNKCDKGLSSGRQGCGRQTPPHHVFLPHGLSPWRQSTNGGCIS